LDNIEKNASIAVYLRKSREDVDSTDTLAKHRGQLSEYVATNGLTNTTWFEEIGSADSIAKRPVFMELLSQVEENEYEGVLVVHFDRLTRGSQIDNGIIAQTFKRSSTLIMTPARTYDLSDESAELMSEVEGLLSRAEYRSIKRRMQQGKVNATKQGKHVSGILPIPYFRDKNTGIVHIDPDKRKIFDFIVESYLSGMSANRIAIELNLRGISTVRGKTWRNRQVLALLKSDFHRGILTYGKLYRGPDGTMCKQTDPSKIISVPGIHEAIIDEATARRIDRALQDSQKIPTKSRSGIFALSGLMRCKACGATVSFTTDNKPEIPVVFLRKCKAMQQDGIHRCSANKGMKEALLLDILRGNMRDFKTTLFATTEGKNSRIDVGQSPIEMNEEIIVNATDKMERLKSIFVDGIIDRKEFDKRKHSIDVEVLQAKKELTQLKQNSEIVSKEIREQRNDNWTNIDIEGLFENQSDNDERNRIFHKLIERIEFLRVGDETDINVVYK